MTRKASVVVIMASLMSLISSAIFCTASCLVCTSVMGSSVFRRAGRTSADSFTETV